MLNNVLNKSLLGMFTKLNFLDKVLDTAHPQKNESKKYKPEEVKKKLAQLKFIQK